MLFLDPIRVDKWSDCTFFIRTLGHMSLVSLITSPGFPRVISNPHPGISLAQANTAGHTKKTVVFAILYIGYAVGNLIGPQTFRASQAPAYTGGFTAMIVCYCVCIGLMCMYWALAVSQNRKIDAGANHSGDDLLDGFTDLTDQQQEGFRYTT